MSYRPRLKHSIEPYIEKLKKLPLKVQKDILQKVFDYDKAKISKVVHNDTTTITSPKSAKIKTLQDLVEACDIDLDRYFVERHIINKWEVGSKVGDVVVTEPLFQVKAWLKPRVEENFIADLREQTKKDFMNFAPIYVGIGRKDDFAKKDCMLEINIFDLHFGKLAHAEETGDKYNVKIAEKRFLSAIQHFIEQTQNYDIQKIVFPIGNDFLNADNLRKQTTKGTPQDEELRWQESFIQGRKLIQKAVDMLVNVAPVEVVVVQGNHDWERSFYLGDAIECWYAKCPEVIVNNSSKPRKYVKYGQCLIGYTHGNNEKVADLPLIMANENKNIWGSVKYKEMHLGHLHHKREIKYMSTREYSGTTIRYMRSMSGSDAWHNIKGYVGSQQGCEAFVWHKDKGMISQIFYNV